MGATHEENDSIEEIPLPVVVFSSQTPIVTQPSGNATLNSWMEKPDVANCPPGLEYLATLDEVHVDHLHDHQYAVTNKRNEKIYQVKLAPTSKYFKTLAQFSVAVFDNYDQEVISVGHEFGCNSCFCCCFLQKIHAVSSCGTELGTLQQEWNVLYPTFAVKTAEGVVLRIEGPCCQLECCSDTDFKIITPDGGAEVGRISKKIDTVLSQKSHFGLVVVVPVPVPKMNDSPAQGYHMGFTLPRDTVSTISTVSPPPLPTITTQPHVKSETNWMNKPQTQAIPNCPPGLEYLTTIDQLIVHQTSDVLQVAAGFETENQYYIANKNDQKVYYAQEKSDAFTRNCCKARRSFEMKVFDNFGKEVVHMNRPFACQAFCFFCCLQSMEVFSPPETLVGVIEQEWSLFSPAFTIKNGDGEIVLRIKGPCNLMNCCSDADFKVMSVDGNTEVGKIMRKSELAQQISSKSDNFGIMFPMDLDVRMKAVMIGACFLIDMMYFETPVSNTEDLPSQTHMSPI